jgi:hypothetical protein
LRQRTGAEVLSSEFLVLSFALNDCGERSRFAEFAEKYSAPFSTAKETLI